MHSIIRISKSALKHNVRAFKNVLPSETKLMAVIKGNAYGHGMDLCARVFAQAGVDWFGVANTTEALKLHQLNLKKPILVLSYLEGSTKELALAIKKGIRLPVYTLDMLRMYERLGKKLKQPVKVHLKFDTGTTRIGFLPDQLPQIIKFLKDANHLNIEGVYSHFAEVESRNQKFSQEQHLHFATLADKLERQLGKRLIKHMNCSAGALVHPDAQFDMARIGMSLYGIWTVSDKSRVLKKHKTFSLIPALTWETRLIQVKSVSKGTTVGYNRTYKFQKPGKIGIIPIGYWDGLNRNLSNCGKVLIDSKYSPIRGIVCMNMTMLDITKIPSACVNSRVILIGENLPVEEMATKSKTITYEVLTRLNPDLPRFLSS